MEQPEKLYYPCICKPAEPRDDDPDPSRVLYHPRPRGPGHQFIAVFRQGGRRAFEVIDVLPPISYRDWMAGLANLPEWPSDLIDIETPAMNARIAAADADRKQATP